MTKKPVGRPKKMTTVVTEKPNKMTVVKPVGRTNPTGRKKRTFRNLSEAHSNAIKEGSIKYHSCCRDNKCGNKYSV